MLAEQTTWVGGRFGFVRPVLRVCVCVMGRSNQNKLNVYQHTVCANVIAIPANGKSNEFQRTNNNNKKKLVKIRNTCRHSFLCCSMVNNNQSFFLKKTKKKKVRKVFTYIKWCYLVWFSCAWNRFAYVTALIYAIQYHARATSSIHFISIAFSRTLKSTNIRCKIVFKLNSFPMFFFLSFFHLFLCTRFFFHVHIFARSFVCLLCTLYLFK